MEDNKNNNYMCINKLLKFKKLFYFKFQKYIINYLIILIK